MWSAGGAVARVALCAGLLTGWTASALAQDSAPERDQPRWSQADGVDIPAIIQANTHEIRRDGDALIGPGAEFLVREAENAQFVLLAEPHNTNEVNEFTGALFELLHDSLGFGHLLLEQGPFIMDKFNDPAVRGDVEALRAIAREYSNALHFRTDSELALFARATGAVADDAADPLWGVDRALSAKIALEALAEVVEGETARERIEAAMEAARKHKRANFFKGPGADYWRQAEAPEIDALLEGLDAPSNDAEAFVQRALRVSRRDLRRWATEHAPTEPWGYAANLDRESLMKAQFADHYRAAQRAGESAPRVLAKLGHWHVALGRNPGNVLTLGNHMKEVAAFHGGEALTINIQPVNKPGQHWSITDYPEYSPVADVGDPSKWLLVDVRPLRDYAHAGLLRVSRELRDVIFGYDAVLLMGGTTRGEATWQRPD